MIKQLVILLQEKFDDIKSC